MPLKSACLTVLLLSSLAACVGPPPTGTVTLFSKGPPPLDPDSPEGQKIAAGCEKCRAQFPSCEKGHPCERDFNTCAFHQGDTRGYCKL